MASPDDSESIKFSYRVATTSSSCKLSVMVEPISHWLPYGTPVAPSYRERNLRRLCPLCRHGHGVSPACQWPVAARGRLRLSFPSRLLCGLPKEQWLALILFVALLAVATCSGAAVAIKPAQRESQTFTCPVSNDCPSGSIPRTLIPTESLRWQCLLSKHSSLTSRNIHVSHPAQNLAP